MSTPPPITTLGALRASGHVHRGVKAEIRENLLARLAAGEPTLPGIVGFDDTVIPEVERALLAGHDMVLLGERGQGKTRLIRTLVRPARRVDAGDRRQRAQRAPVRAGRPSGGTGSSPSAATRRRSAWKHRSERYGEKLATPDTSVGDLIGDVDPIKVAEGRTLGDPETVHYGLVLRTNRGIFAVNELPDLAERIQVALLNVLEERDIQVRGYQLRLPLDLLLVASANPEDYTNRGRIITPLKDRFGAEVRTHYPLDLADELELVRQEAALVWDLDGTHPAPVVPDHLLEVVARFTRAVREAPQVDQRSGVSARFAIAAVETVAASAVRRAAVTGEQLAVARVCDLPAVVAGLARQGRVRGRRRGPGDRGARAPAAPGDRGHLPGPAGRPGPVRAAVEVRRGAVGRDRRPGAGGRAAATRSARSRPWPRCCPGWSRPPVRRVPRPSGSPPPRVEFALEGLHLLRRLAKDDVGGGRTVYGG